MGLCALPRRFGGPCPFGGLKRVALHHDLLHQARQLATHEPRRPKQASLRRAVSTAYYALFHLLTLEATDRMITGHNRDSLRLAMRRAFDHVGMKEACKEIVKPNARRLSRCMANQSPSVTLKKVADTFVALQQARHEADYDLFRTFTRSEVLTLVGQVERAFLYWKAISKDVEADVLLVALLAHRGLFRQLTAISLWLIRFLCRYPLTKPLSTSCRLPVDCKP